VVCGVGHETDFTIADFCADVRAPTPTAAAELCAQPQASWLAALEQAFSRLQNGVDRQMQAASQRLDRAAARVSQPSHLITRQHGRLGGLAQSLAHAMQLALSGEKHRLETLRNDLPKTLDARLMHSRHRLERAQLRLDMLDPHLVLQRGYAWLADLEGNAITSVKSTHPGQPVRATLADGQVDLAVAARRLI
ncbi:MAG: Exodeoxyribonuclease large subunit, partial [Polaromonas sp.]|nr:Exodeoxyribonuclease large subunit [Polaromonas sp.]